MLLFGLYAGALIFVLFRMGFFRLEGRNARGLYLAFGVKLAVSLVLFWFPYDTLKDAFIYIKDAEMLAGVFGQNPGAFFELLFDQSRGHLDQIYLLDSEYWSHETDGLLSERRNVIRLNAVLSLLSFGNTYVLLLWNALISFLGLKLIYKSALAVTSASSNLLFLALFFLPSTLLWTSIVMKETILVLGLGLIFYAGVQKFNSVKRVAWFLLGFALIFMVKQYVALALVPAFLIYGLLKFFDRKYALVIYTASVLLGLLVFFFAPLPIHEKLVDKQKQFVELGSGHLILVDAAGNNYRTSPESAGCFDPNLQDLNAIQKPFKAFYLEPVDQEGKGVFIRNREDCLAFSVEDYRPKSGSFIAPVDLGDQPSDFVLSAPKALLNVLFRPLPQDPPEGVGKWYFFLENLGLLFLLGFSFLKGNVKNTLPEVLFLLTFSLLLALIIGWTIPILGAVVRYKLPIVIALIMVSCLLLGAKKKNLA